MSTLQITINPTTKQDKAWAYLEDNETTELLFGGGAGGGKAQPLDALISTPFGFKPMGCVRVGDALSHPSGTSTFVIGLHPQGTKPIYRLTFSDGASCEATDEHLWLVRFSSKQKKQERNSGNRGVIRTSQWLFDYMQKVENQKRKAYPIIPLSRPVQYTLGRGRGRQAARDIDPYLLGVLIGDGHLKRHISFTSADPEIATYIEDAGYSVTHQSGTYTYRIVGERLADGTRTPNRALAVIRELGLDVGSSDKFVPKYFFTASIAERVAIIQGLLDTDGYADSRGHISFTSVSRQLAEDVQFIARSLGGKATITSDTGSYRDPTGTQITCQPAYTVYITIDQPGALFRLARKKKRCQSYEFNGGNSAVGRRLVRVEYVGEKEAQCITVDNPDGLYITNDFIVTHNSRLICEWASKSCIRYPGIRALLGRSELKNLKQSTLLTLFEVLSDWGLKADVHYRYNQQESIVSFWNGSAIYLKDLATYPSDPNFDSLGSTEYTIAAIDEANQVSHRAKEVVKSRLRYKLSDFSLIPKLAMSCNPAKNWVYAEFYKPWKDGRLPTGKAFVQALVTDNPHISPHYIEELKSLTDQAMKERLLHGNWEYDDDPLALFPADAIADIFTNKVGESADFYITCDAARLGRDLCVILVWKGWQVVHITSYEISRTTRIEGEIERLRAVYGIGRSHVIVDEGGVGGGVVDHLEGVKGFNAGARPIQDERKRLDADPTGQKPYEVNYANLKAQCYYLLADRVINRRVAIPYASPEQQELITADLEQMKGVNADKDGKLKVTDKETIREHINRSPDFGDAIALRVVFDLEPEELQFGMWVA
jgi:hypothetical protein